ncbi:MAG: ROK family protein [Ruminococcus sp.]|nr:ROK family protein [Ruminococcus sp.]
MTEHGISKLDLKRRNRMQILRVLRENGPTSRVDLSKILQLTRAAVTLITNEMLGQNILIELGNQRPSREKEVRKGRRKILLDINPTFRFALGLYIDEHSLSIGLTTLNFEALEKRTMALPQKASRAEIVALIRDESQRVLQNSCLHEMHIVGMGIGIMPSMWERLEITDSQSVSRLEEEIGEGLSFGVYAGNAIALFAVASNHYQEHFGHPLNQVLLYADENEYHLAALYQNHLRSEFQMNTHVVNSFCINPGGLSCEGYCNGSVKAELTAEAIGRKAAEYYSETQTPALYQLTRGQGKRITLAQMLSALEAGDTLLRPLVQNLMDQFCLLLNNLEQMFFAHRICLYKFGFRKRHMEMLCAHMTQFSGAESAAKLVLCDIEDPYRFTSGCAYAIQAGFFNRGGLTLEIDDEDTEGSDA